MLSEVESHVSSGDLSDLHPLSGALSGAVSAGAALLSALRGSSPRR